MQAGTKPGEGVAIEPTTLDAADAADAFVEEGLLLVWGRNLAYLGIPKGYISSKIAQM